MKESDLQNSGAQKISDIVARQARYVTSEGIERALTMAGRDTSGNKDVRLKRWLHV